MDTAKLIEDPTVVEEDSGGEGAKQEVDKVTPDFHTTTYNQENFFYYNFHNLDNIQLRVDENSFQRRAGHLEAIIHLKHSLQKRFIVRFMDFIPYVHTHPPYLPSLRSNFNPFALLWCL